MMWNKRCKTQSKVGYAIHSIEKDVKYIVKSCEMQSTNVNAIHLIEGCEISKAMKYNQQRDIHSTDGQAEGK